MSILHELRDQLTAALKDQKDYEHCPQLASLRTDCARLKVRADAPEARVKELEAKVKDLRERVQELEAKP